jgi:hypothetical protein
MREPVPVWVYFRKGYLPDVSVLPRGPFDGETCEPCVAIPRAEFEAMQQELERLRGLRDLQLREPKQSSEVTDEMVERAARAWYVSEIERFYTAAPAWGDAKERIRANFLKVADLIIRAALSRTEGA